MPVSLVARITYTVLVETLNPAQSINLVSMSVYQSVSAFKSQICFTDQDTVMLHYHSKVHFNAI